MGVTLNRLGAIVLVSAIFFWPGGLAAQAPDPGGSNCDPYDELRCTRGYDWKTCSCIGEPPPLTDTCNFITSEQAGQSCLNYRIAQLAQTCQQQHWTYQTNPWVQEQFSAYWTWTFNLDVQYQWRVTLPQMPAACQ